MSRFVSFARSAFISSVLLAVTQFAQTTSWAGDIACPDADIFSRLITDICWSCAMPIKLFGFVDVGNEPEGAATGADTPVCQCPDPLGVPEFGFRWSSWMPRRIQEVTPKPYCMPTLGGIRVRSNIRMLGGNRNKEHDSSGNTFQNHHQYSFPLFAMLDLFLTDGCSDSAYSSLDVITMSEFSPLWNNDLLAFILNPESVLFGNVVAQMACTVDCTASTVGKATQHTWFCAGCNGSLYPFTGNTIVNHSPVQVSSLIAHRALALHHRMGLARLTMGNEAMCKPPYYQTIPRTQYKHQMIYPLAERETGSCCHELGANTLSWGDWRSPPGMPDHVYLLWNYRDCCLR
jgi:conjugal transfer pilus assembly protein TraU